MDHPVDNWLEVHNGGSAATAFETAHSADISLLLFFMTSHYKPPHI